MSHSSRDPLEEQQTDLKMNLERLTRTRSFIDAIRRRGLLTIPMTVADSTDVDDSMKITDLRKKVDILKRALTACCKNTDFSDTVAVLMSRSRKYERLA
jgi:hypothetical protein